MLNEMCTIGGLSLVWTGNNGFIMHTAGKLIAFDLDLYNTERITPCPTAVIELCKALDVLFVTHAHEDHMSTETIAMLIEQSHCQFVIPASCDHTAIPNERLLVVKPNEEHCVNGIEFRTIRAVHGHIGGSVYSGASMADCGYVITLGGRTIYQPGDTILLEEHYSMTGIDLLFLSTTEHTTWIDNSIKLVQLIDPKLIVPQHHSTYVEATDNLFWTHGHVFEVYDGLNETYRSRYRVLPQNRIIPLDI